MEVIGNWSAQVAVGTSLAALFVSQKSLDATPVNDLMAALVIQGLSRLTHLWQPGCLREASSRSDSCR